MGDLAVQDQYLTMVEKLASSDAVDADKLSKIIDAQERVYNKNAQIAFNASMRSCQEEMPTVAKDADNTQTNSRYARYETIITTTKQCYTKHGFSLSFGTEQSPVTDHIRVTCDVMHRDGHTKHVFVDLPLDMTGIKGSVNKTQIHATASTYSYGKRYLFCMVFNIPIADQDDDAVKAGGVTVEQLLEYNEFVRENFDIINQIKTGIMTENLYDAAIAWQDWDQSEKQLVWKAPSKGGIFTTYEREVIKSKAFGDALRGE